MPSLVEIVKRGEIVLLDSNVLHGVDDDGFSESIYEASDFSHINSRRVARKLHSFNSSFDVLSRPNVVTIEEVSDEMMEFARIINQKIKYAAESLKMDRGQRIRRKEEARQNTSSKMNELYMMAVEVTEAAKRKDVYKDDRFGIDLRCRDILYEITRQIGTTIRLKPKKPRFFGHKVIDNSSRTDTDEKLAVTLYCLSLYSGKRACLATGDTDFFKLLGLLSKLIGSYEFMPYNDDFREALTYNPFRFYLNTPGTEDFQLQIDSSKIPFMKLFDLMSVPKFKRDELRDKVFGLWKDFYEQSQQHNQRYLQKQA